MRIRQAHRPITGLEGIEGFVERCAPPAGASVVPLNPDRAADCTDAIRVRERFEHALEPAGIGHGIGVEERDQRGACFPQRAVARVREPEAIFAIDGEAAAVHALKVGQQGRR